MKQTVATFTVNGEEKALTVELCGSGKFWTADDLTSHRDFKTRRGAVNYLKRVYADPGVEVEWSE